ncbi:RsmE family RNA methyltransferase [Candidatus Laterigemmans baculatus]|uniref:RsmE family RNA methyltransferase n=1 Tax=Candidatus Laterigemmans baculatus TaxID=2770505 RepID=UPI0013DCBC0D|nr:RsmE family RNA methyltransferase [Candidatus Laterigemmans baculatus]
MTRRYFVPELSPTGGPLGLPADEAAHAARVMRATPGDRVVLFCGDGREAEAEITSVDKRHVFVLAEPPRNVDRELPFPLSVAASLPKADRARVLVEKLTELGVTQLQPLVCQRTQLAPSPAAIAKLRRAVVEASKQCGRNRLMQIGEATSFSQYLHQTDPDAASLIAHPDGHSLAVTLKSSGGDDGHSPVQIAVGPEGGFTDAEVEQAVETGWQRITLGPRILRIETAATAIVARIVLA